MEHAHNIEPAQRRAFDNGGIDGTERLGGLAELCLHTRRHNRQARGCKYVSCLPSRTRASREQLGSCLITKGSAIEGPERIADCPSIPHDALVRIYDLGNSAQETGLGFEHLEFRPPLENIAHQIVRGNPVVQAKARGLQRMIQLLGQHPEMGEQQGMDAFLNLAKRPIPEHLSLQVCPDNAKKRHLTRQGSISDAIRRRVERDEPEAVKLLHDGPRSGRVGTPYGGKRSKGSRRNRKRCEPECGVQTARIEGLATLSPYLVHLSAAENVLFGAHELSVQLLRRRDALPP